MMIIYPTLSKNRPLDIEPYATCYRYLRGCLSSGCQLCVVVGFSFRDGEIRKIFAESLQVNELLRLIVMDPNPDEGRILTALGTEYTRIRFISEPFRHYGLDANATLREELLRRMSDRSIFKRDSRLGTPEEQFAQIALLKGLPGI